MIAAARAARPANVAHVELASAVTRHQGWSPGVVASSSSVATTVGKAPTMASVTPNGCHLRDIKAGKIPFWLLDTLCAPADLQGGELAQRNAKLLAQCGLSKVGGSARPVTNSSVVLAAKKVGW